METTNRSWSDSFSAALRSILPEILTVDEAAKLLRLNRKTLYEVIRLQRPAWAIRFGRTIRVSRDALLRAFWGNRSPALGEK
ncbi:MAG TPA: helix-turn-helix domain-containing protein [Myxococcaceae bacterium]|nr:helix-turn-helix domain-containing protein [Myxococcaceae bacterium]